MIKNQVTVDCKIKFLKNLIEKKQTEDEIFLKDEKIKNNVTKALEDAGWIIKKDGRYQLNTNVSLDSYTIKSGEPRENFVFPKEDWVKSQTAKYLKENGYQIVYIAWGHDKGTDVIGYNPIKNRFINIEAKGGTKAEKTDFYECLGQCVASISNNDEDYAIAFPWRTQNDRDYNNYYNVYGECWNSINKDIKKQLNIKSFFIDSNENVFISDETKDVYIDEYTRMYNLNNK